MARDFNIARGWERQADIDHGPFFYTKQEFDVATYTQWLADQHVEYVALSDLDVDSAGVFEAELLRSGDAQSELTEVWSGTGWTIWRVNNFGSCSAVLSSNVCS